MVTHNRLSIYVNDHLALVVGEIDLARRCRANNDRGELGAYLEQAVADLQEEKKILEDLLSRLDAPENLIKQGVAWLAEKAGRFKLNDSILRYSQLSRLVELETLYLAAVERHSFWENLIAVRADYPAFSDIDFAHRNKLAVEQAEQLRRFRTQAAVQCF